MGAGAQAPYPFVRGFMQYSYTRTVEPTVEPLTLAEAKMHLQQAFSHEDSYITTLIKVARSLVETVTDRSLLSQTWVKRQDSFTSPVLLLKTPIVAISNITYAPTATTTQTLSSSLYQADLTSKVCRLFPADGTSWPTTASIVNAVSITYTTGYGATAAAVPEALKHAMLLILRYLYDNRASSASSSEVASLFGFDALVSDYKVGWF